MSYDARDGSREHGMPVNLVLFRYGVATASVFGYTDAEQPIVRDNVTYVPVSVDTPAVQASGSLDRKTLNLRLPSNTDVAQLFRVYPPSYPVTMTIFRGHLTDDDVPIEWRAIWIGRILNGKHEGDGSHVCTFTCEPVATSLKRSGLRRRYQYLCPHVLYGRLCNANKGAVTFSVIAAEIGEAEVVLTPGWAPADLIPNFSGGVIEWTTAAGNIEVRTILEIEETSNGHTVWMTGPTTGILTATSLRLSLGCNHQMDHCLVLHNNIHNFGGQPWIPTSNPIGTFSNSFY